MNADTELQAMAVALEAIQGLEKEAQTRVLSWIASRLDINNSDIKTRASTTKQSDNETGENQRDGFKTFMELFEAIQPTSDKERALVASYWLQVELGQEAFPAQPVNNELKNMGVGLSNVTDTLSRLIQEKPALVLQVRKSGLSKQGRKSYRLTQAGIKRVQSLLNVGSHQFSGDEE